MMPLVVGMCVLSASGRGHPDPFKIELGT